jgi:hypothetical protein
MVSLSILIWLLYKIRMKSTKRIDMWCIEFERPIQQAKINKSWNIKERITNNNEL